MFSHIRVLRAACIAGAVVLSGCKTFSPDGGMGSVAALAGQELNKDVVQIRSAEDAAWEHDSVTRLLQRPLSADATVQIALLNNLGLQAAYNRLGLAEAVMVQASRPPVPTFSISQVSTSLELDIERQIVGSILALATLPARSEIAAERFEQAKLRAAEETLRIAAETRRAYFRAVAARQIVTALTETEASAQSSAELATKLQQTGAVNRLEQARRQVFATEVEAQLMGARQQMAATREQLTRLMGLSHSNLDAQLPSALPPLPKGVRTLASVEQEAMHRRVDLQIAQIEMEALARSPTKGHEADRRDGQRQEPTERRNSMRTFVFPNLTFGTLGLLAFASAPLTFAVAHEGHQMECNETGINAMNADIQSMNDGEARTIAMKEMKMAEEMMAKKDMQACMTHMHNAMEATEK